ncbi:unnamed protein product [Ixodes hexagonus]
MEEGEEQDLATTVLTCEGDLRDPAFPGRLQSLVLRLRELISDEEKPFWVKKVEPWNSVRVTFTLPREAALRLRQLAERGDRALRDLGILSVQLEGDQIISLTLAGRYGEPPKEIILQKAAGETEAGSPSSSPAGPASPSTGVGRPGPSGSAPDSALARGGASAPFALGAASTSGGFRSPNVVAPPPREPLPFLSGAHSRFVRPGARTTRAPFPFASMTHSMKQNNNSGAGSSSGSAAVGASRFQFNAMAARGVATATARGNVALSSPLLVNLLQSETGNAGALPQKLMMPPPLDTGQQPKRKRRPPRSARGRDGASPPGSPSSPASPSYDPLPGQGFPSHIPLSPPRSASGTVPTAASTSSLSSPPAESRVTKHLINPFTGHLEPMPSDEEEEEAAVRDPETSESSENGGHSERSLSDGGKDSACPSSDTDSGIGKSSSSQSSNDPEPPPREDEMRPVAAVTASSSPEGEKLKLRLKLDSSAKRSVVVSATAVATKQQQSGSETPPSSPRSPVGEPPRVPPLHISLRGPNAAVVVSPHKAAVASTDNVAVPKKRPPRPPRSSASSSSTEESSRRGCRSGTRGRDKASERLRELSLLSGGGIVRVPVSMSPTVVLTPLHLQHPMRCPSAPSSSSTPRTTPACALPGASASCTQQSTKVPPTPRCPPQERPELPHALRSSDGPASSSSSALPQSGNGESAANSALGAPDGHTAPHRTVRAQPVLMVEANGTLHSEDNDEDDDEQRSSLVRPRACLSPSATVTALATRNNNNSAIEGIGTVKVAATTNHVESMEDDTVCVERRLARIISVDPVAAKKACAPVFDVVSELDVPVAAALAAGKLGGLVGGNHHRMPSLIPTGGTAFHGDVVLRREYRHNCSQPNSVLKPGIVRMNRLRFNAAGFANAAALARAETVTVKTNGVLSPPPGECDSTIDAELECNGPTSTTTLMVLSPRGGTLPSAAAGSAMISVASDVSGGGYVELPSSYSSARDTNGGMDFSVANGDGVVTTTHCDGDGASPDSNSGPLRGGRGGDALGLCDGDGDGDRSGDEEASSALSEERGDSSSPPSESPSRHIPPDTPTPATTTTTTVPLADRCQSPLGGFSSPASTTVSSQYMVPDSSPSPSVRDAAVPASSASSSLWKCAAGVKAQSVLLQQPQDASLSNALQVPSGRLISSSQWGSESSQQRLTLIIKSALGGGAGTGTTANATCQRSLLPLPGSMSSLAVASSAKTQPIKVLSLPSESPSLALKSSLAELIAPTSSAPPSPVLVVSRASPVSTTLSSSTVNTAVGVKSVVMTGMASAAIATPATGIVCSSASASTSVSAEATPSNAATQPFDATAFFQLVEAGVEPDSLVTEEEPTAAAAVEEDGVLMHVAALHSSEADRWDEDPTEATRIDRLDPMVLMANHTGSQSPLLEAPDSFSAMLAPTGDRIGEVDDLEARLHGLHNHHGASEDDDELANDEVGLLVASLEKVEGGEDEERPRNQRRRMGRASPTTTGAQHTAAAASSTPSAPSDHSSEEEMSLSELAHKSRTRAPSTGSGRPPLRPHHHPPPGGKENEREEALAPPPTPRREEGAGGRPRRLAAEPKGGRRPQQMAAGGGTGAGVQHQQQQVAPVNSLPSVAEEALRRATERSRRSPAATRDHRSPPRVTNQRNYRRDQESSGRDDDTVVAIKRKTRASGPSTDPQQEAAAPNKRRRYSKDSHR